MCTRTLPRHLPSHSFQIVINFNTEASTSALPFVRAFTSRTHIFRVMPRKEAAASRYYHVSMSVWRERCHRAFQPIKGSSKMCQFEQVPPFASSQMRPTTTTSGCYFDFRQFILPQKSIKSPKHGRARIILLLHISSDTVARKPSRRAACALGDGSQWWIYTYATSAVISARSAHSPFLYP